MIKTRVIDVKVGDEVIMKVAGPSCNLGYEDSEGIVQSIDSQYHELRIKMTKVHARDLKYVLGEEIEFTIKEDGWAFEPINRDWDK